MSGGRAHLILVWQRAKAPGGRWETERELWNIAQRGVGQVSGRKQTCMSRQQKGELAVAGG